MSLSLTRPLRGRPSRAVVAWASHRREAGALLRLAAPIALIALVNMGMSVTDAAMVSRFFGTEAFAAVAVGSDLYSILFYVGAGVVAGLSPFYTAAATRGDAGGLARLEQLGWRLVASCALVLAPLIWYAPRWLGVLGIDPALLAQGQGYTRAMALTLVPMLGVALLRTLLTAAGKPRLFLWVTLAMLPLNALTNWVLMIGLGPLPAFGAAGVGLSSLLVAGASLLILLFVLRSSPRAAAPTASQPGELTAVLRVGVPIAVATLAEVGIWLGATIYTARLGTAEVAAHTLALRTAGVAYAVPAALLQAGMVRLACAEALGDAHAARRVAQSALALSLLGGLALCGLLLAVSGVLPGAVFDDGAAGRAAASRAAWLLAILGLTELALGPSSAAAGLLRGRKDARAPMAHVLIGLWVVGAPLGLVLSEGVGLGAVGLWAGLGLGTLVTAALSINRLRRGGFLA